MSDVNEILSAMEGNRSTNGWDMICSYSEAIINTMYEKKYEQDKLVSSFKVEGDFENVYDEQVHLIADLHLRAPKIQFLSAKDNQCELLMKISGGSVTLVTEMRDIRTYPIDPDVLMIDARVPIGAITGDWTKAAEVSDGKTPIVFQDNESTTNHIFLHFNNSRETGYSFISVPGKETEAKKQVLLAKREITKKVLELVCQFFKENVSQIDYELASLKSMASSSTLTLNPQSFVFSIIPQIGDSPAALNLYIQTKESGLATGDLEPSFQPAGRTLSPLTKDYSAALIIGKDCLEKLICKGFSTYKAEIKSHEKNMIEVKLFQNKTLTIPPVSESTFMCVNRFDGFTMDLSNQPMYLTIKQTEDENKKISISVELAFKSEKAQGNYMFSTERHTESGYVTATLEIDYKKDNLALGKDGVIDWGIKVPSDKVTVDTAYKCESLLKFLDLKELQNSLKEQFKTRCGDISFVMNSINTFLTTNLLFPEKNIFSLKENDLFYIPFDFITFGNIVTDSAS